MWHQVADVARHRQVDVADLVDFSLSRDQAYGIILKNGDALIDDTFVDQMMIDYYRELQERESAACWI